MVMRRSKKDKKCHWKVLKKRTVKCTNECPKPRKKFGPCIKGKKLELKVTFKKSGKLCKSIVTKLRSLKCDKKKRCSKKVKMTTTKCNKKTGKRNVTMMVMRRSKKDKKCHWSKPKTKVVKCKNECPKPKEKTSRCVMGKRYKLKVSFKKVGNKCVSVTVKLRSKKCGSTHTKKCKPSKYRLKKCTGKSNSTHIMKTYYKKEKGKCVKKTKKFKRVPCKCYRTKIRHIRITVGRKCQAGYKTRYLHFFEERKGKCSHVKVSLRRIKCDKVPNKRRCSRRVRVRASKCDKKTKTRRVTLFIRSRRRSSKKCHWKIKKTSVVKCKNECPKPIQKTSPCIMGRKFKLRVTFKKRGDKCISITVKMKKFKCSRKNKCSLSPKIMATKCKKNKRVLSIMKHVSVKSSSKSNRTTKSKCIWKLVKKVTKRCRNTCPRPKVKKTPCIMGRRATLRISYKLVGSQCQSVTVKLRLSKCNRKRRCSRRRHYKVTSCKSGTRSIVLYKLRRKDKVCKWKIVKKTNRKCKSKCPAPKTRRTRCRFGRRYLLRTSYRHVGKLCVPKVKKLKLKKCGGCRRRTIYRIKGCKKGANTTKLVRLKYRNCKVTKKTLKKNISCSCYRQNKRGGLKLSLNTKCVSGYKYGILSYFNAHKSAKCQVKRLNIRITRCGGKKCRRRRLLRISVCNKGYRTVQYMRVSNKKSGTEIVGQCRMRVVRSKRFRCRTTCPSTKPRKGRGRCIKGRQLLAYKEYASAGKYCRLRRIRYKWIKCKKSSKKCPRRYKLQRTKCKKGRSYIVVTRYRRSKGKCVAQRKKIDQIKCSGKCIRRIRPRLVAGKCDKKRKRKNIYLISTKKQQKKCMHKIRRIGRISCKDC